MKRVFDIAERNCWIHGHILNPVGDFSQLTRLRIETSGGGKMTVTNANISLDTSPFSGFYEAFKEFENSVGVTKIDADRYITEIQKP